MIVRKTLIACGLVCITLSPVAAQHDRDDSARPNRHEKRQRHAGNRDANAGDRCTTACRHNAAAAFEACLENGGTEDECAARVREQLSTCLADCSDEILCAMRCNHHARQLHRECLADGGDPRRCRRASREALRQCMVEVCGVLPPCRVRCQSAAKDAYHECVEDGGDEDACGLDARELFARCIEENECPKRPRGDDDGPHHRRDRRHRHDD